MYYALHVLCPCLQYEVPSAGCFREEVENMKIWFSSHNFMTTVGGRHKYLGGTIQEHDKHSQPNMDLVNSS